MYRDPDYLISHKTSEKINDLLGDMATDALAKRDTGKMSKIKKVLEDLKEKTSRDFGYDPKDPEQLEALRKQKKLIREIDGNIDLTGRI